MVKNPASREMAQHSQRHVARKITMIGNPLLRGLHPSHHGEMLREDIFPALGKTKTEVAKLLGDSRQTLYDILNEKQPITASMALRLGKLLGDGGEIWMRIQIAYDLKMLSGN